MCEPVITFIGLRLRLCLTARRSFATGVYFPPGMHKLTRAGALPARLG